MLTSIIQPIRQSARYTRAITDTYRFTGILEESFLRKLSDAMSLAGGKELCHGELCSAELEFARFEGIERLEDTLGRWTQRICSQTGQLQLEVNNFGGIPPNKVYARILDPGPVKKLLADLRKLDLYLTGNGQEPLEASNRYIITLTEPVLPDQFENLLYRLGRIEFREQMHIKGLSLQRKKQQQWVNVRQFNFSE
jgi:hypothetical protein